MGDGAPLLTNGLDSPDHRGVLSAPLWGDDWFRPPAKRAWRGPSIATPSSVPPTAPTRLLPSCGRRSATSLFHRFMQVADNKTMEPVARHSAATRLRVAERTEVSTDSDPVQQFPGGVRGHEKSPLVARLRGWRPKRTRPGAWNDWLAAIDGSWGSDGLEPSGRPGPPPSASASAASWSDGDPGAAVPMRADVDRDENTLALDRRPSRPARLGTGAPARLTPVTPCQGVTARQRQHRHLACPRTRLANSYGSEGAQGWSGEIGAGELAAYPG